MNGVAILGGYLLGSIPFAVLVAGADVRRAGSGNPGASNVWRVRGPAAALGVLVLDIGKGAAPVWLSMMAGGDGLTAAVAGGSAIVGHVYPIWLRFAGGKGIATAFGVFLAVAPLAAAAGLVLFVVSVWKTRYVSVGSMLVTVCLPVLMFVLHGDTPGTGLAAAAAPLLLFRHRSNLSRLMAGTEHRLGDRADG